MKNILVVGGAGYIGSHVCLKLKDQNFNPIVFDDFSTGHEWACQFGPSIQGHLLNYESINTVFKDYSIDAVMHLAAFIQVGESVQKPLHYYENNVMGTINLLKAMDQYKVNTMVFSSTAAVYGAPQYTPMDENHPQQPLNPYGMSKWMVERILHDCAISQGLRFVTLRYFNAAGAAPDQDLGEAHEPETHLIPLLIRSTPSHPITIFGNDYETQDGSCVRDYIHVLDLADAHIKALDYINNGGINDSFNLGTEHGTSNFEVITTIEKHLKRNVPIIMGARRAGDPPTLLSSSKKAKEILNWEPKYSLDDIVKSAIEWELKFNTPILHKAL
jgi:UDP-glucose-4-epimerase GalE